VETLQASSIPEIAGNPGSGYYGEQTLLHLLIILTGTVIVILPDSDHRLFSLLFFFGLGAGLVIASVIGDFQNWWVVRAAMMAIMQIPIFIKTLRG
jgi:ABC-type xylose transport system permease subunit